MNDSGYIEEDQDEQEAVTVPTETVEEEVLLHFKRFPQDKQDQVRALVNYATLMGLNGKDLVSIGGKLTRIASNREKLSNQAIVQSMNIRPIGKDKDFRNRWAYTDAGGTVYHFKSSYSRYDITNLTTKKVAKGYTNTWYELNRRFCLRGNYDLPNIMMNVFHGTITLP